MLGWPIFYRFLGLYRESIFYFAGAGDFHNFLGFFLSLKVARNFELQVYFSEGRFLKKFQAFFSLKGPHGSLNTRKKFDNDNDMRADYVPVLELECDNSQNLQRLCV